MDAGCGKLARLICRIRKGDLMRRLIMALALLVISSATLLAASGPYRFRPGDVIEISVWQEPKLNRQVVVAPDGTIALPLAGRFRAGGVTAQMVENALKERLKKQYTTDLDVTVSLVAQKPEEYRPETVEKEIDPLIYVTGEVNKPGAFALQMPTTVLQAIALSGGLSPYAAKKRIVVRRKIKGFNQTYAFNYYEAEDGEDIEGNIYLKPGDVVVVPERGIFE